MDRRKEELEKKRAKLAELRRAREERKAALLAAQNKDVAPNGVGPSLGKEKQDVDDLVASLVGEKRGVLGAGVGMGGGSAERRMSMHSGYNDRMSVATLVDGAGEAANTGSATPTGYPSVNRGIPEFGMVEAVIFDMPPKEAQTMEDFYAKPDPEVLEHEIQTRLRVELDKEAREREKALEEERRRRQAEQAMMIRELDEGEIKDVMKNEEFVEFVDYSSKLVERALAETYDFMTDYTIVRDTEGEVSSGTRVKLHCDFYDEKLCRNRSVMDIDWSQKYPELLVAAYNKNSMAPHEPDGVALVWNTHLTTRPEFVFHAQSDIVCVRFSPFHPNLIAGAMYSGQLVLWDTRAKHLPVLKTPLSAVGHTHPVYAMELAGTQNAHNLITASTDGLVCSWQLDMLAQPQETLELTHPSPLRTDEVAVTTFGFPDNETTTFWVGTEEGAVYQANRYDRAGNKAGLNQYDAYRGHYGPVTSLHFHPLSGPVDFSDLMLTSSVDWTVKLWRARTKTTQQPQTYYPMYSFDVADDYVYDVRWSPSHPALFASVDGTGRMDLWNLNHDTEVPMVSTQVTQGRALNKVRWDRDGRRVACASSDGHVYTYDIGDLASPRMEEWTLLQKTVAEMQAVGAAKAEAQAAEMSRSGPGYGSRI